MLNNGNRFHEPDETEELRRKYMANNNSAIAFFRNIMQKRESEPKRNDRSTIEVVFKTYQDWYNKQNYPKRYMKNRKEFFYSIAAFVGEDYEDMKKKVHTGFCLKDYELTDEGLRITLLER